MIQRFCDEAKKFDPQAVEPPLNLWKRALEVRRLAERAALGVNLPTGDRPVGHPYSERLWTHLAPAVVEADIRRRNGEDWLFASLDDGHKRSTDDLSAAEKQFQNVLHQGQALQTAYAARDDALADLPPLTRWVASQSGSDARVEDLRDLWQNKVHPLARQLEGPDRPVGVDKLAAEVHDAVHRLRREYVDRCRDLRDRDLQGVWEQIEQALAVPPMLLDPDLRASLAKKSRQQVINLSEAWVINPTPVATPTSATADDIRAARRGQALRWGRLAAAVLGDVTKDQRSDRKGDLLAADALQAELTKLPQDNWQPQVTVVGDQIGRHWQLLAAAREGEAPAEPGAPAAGQEPRPPDTVAESRSRWAVAFRPADGPEPATVNRQKRWQALLVGLALRTARDHWYSSEPRPDQYFREAANLYLGDAKRAAGDGTAAAPGSEPVLDLLRADALVLERVKFDPRVYLTDQSSRTLTFAVKSPKAGPGGYVTLWPQLSQSAALSLPGDDRPRQPIALPATRDVHIEANRLATDDTAKLILHGYFRGQWLGREAETEVKLTRTPDLILARATPPNDAAVAVRASDDLDVGAIAIVLDFSGSMAERPNADPDWTKDDSKNKKALATLKEVLRGLPAGTPLSVRQFGHKRVFNQQRYTTRYYQLTEAQRRDQDLVAVLGTEETGSELIFKGKADWTAKDQKPLNDLIAALDTEPKGGTPLLKTMVEAKEDFPEGYKGAKTLLVLTDGADMSFPKASRVAAIKKGLRAAFADADVSIQMVLFRVTESELTTAQNQFGDVEAFPDPGRLWVAGDNSKLSDMVDQALRPKLRLMGPTGKAVNGAGLPADRDRTTLYNLRWSGKLDPKVYEGRVLQAKQLLDLRRGDRMLVRLFKDHRTGVRFQRTLLADELPRNRVARDPQSGWALGLAYYHPTWTNQGNLLALTTTLEQASQPLDEGDTLVQPRPAFVWWEVTPQSGGKAKTVRVDERPQLPAPAWTMLASDWPGSLERYRPATIKVWADLTPPPPAGKKVSIDPAQLAAGEVRAEVATEDGPVQLFVSLEKTWPLRVDTDPDNDFKTADPPGTPCLVVRVLYPDKKPMVVRPVGITFEASEHRFYGSAAAATAAFGRVNSRDDLEARLGSRPLELELVSVENFKARVNPVVLEPGEPHDSQTMVAFPNLPVDKKAP
jgi:hypothetical protein